MSSASYVRDRLRGVATGLLTPFDERSEINHGHLQENARTLYDHGARTFLAPANISEYHSLTRNERVAFAESSLDALPSDACVLAGVGGSTGTAQELIEAYDRIGVDGMMLMPPDHTYIHEQGVLDYYDTLAAVTETPLVPYVRGFDPSVEFLADLTRVDGVAGVKYAIRNAVKLGDAIPKGDDDVVWVNGLAEPFAPSFWSEGVEGFSAGVSNFRPEVGFALFDALSAGEWQRARELRNICLPFQRFRDETGENNTIPGAVSVPVLKQGLELAGLHGGTVRKPIRSLSPEEKERARRLYDRLDDDINRLVN